MAQLLFEDDAGAANYVIFDAVLREDIAHTAFVTQYPIEDGSSVADHSQPVPLTITLEGYVSDTPVIPPSTQNAGVGGSVRSKELELRDLPNPSIALPSGRVVSGIIDRITAAIDKPSANVLQFDGRLNRNVNVFDVLDTLLTEGRPLTVIFTEDHQFQNMVITNVSRPRSSGQGSGITFQIELVQVQLVRSQIGAAPIPLTPRGSPQKNKGNQAGSDSASAVPPLSAAKVSALAQIAGL